MALTFRERNFIGMAGEFRVMSELLLKGFNPAKSYLQDGYDLILDNGIRIEVKSSHRYDYDKKYHSTKIIKGKKYKNWSKAKGYNFTFRSASKKGKILKSFDYAICWCIDDSIFYVIPVGEINGGAIHIADISLEAEHKFNKYRNNWQQLGGG